MAMDWLQKFFKKEVVPKVSLPPDWPLEAPMVRPTRPKAAPAVAAPKAAQKTDPQGVINLATPPPPPRANKSRGKISTPVPAKKGEKTLNLAGKPDAYSRRSKSVIDMRNKQR